MNELLKKGSKELPAITLAYLGPNGNFTHMAALEYAMTREKTQLVSSKNLAEIFKIINENSVDRAIVPIDNSSDGHIKDTLKALREMDFKIIGELVVPVSLSFVMRKDANPTEVWSKDTALRQAEKFLQKKYPHLKKIEHISTGDAISQASKNPSIAAIGSKISAKEQGLDLDSLIQIDGIEDNPANATRFAVIAKNQELSLIIKDSKTSFIANVTDQPGSLFQCLDILKCRGINLTQLKSFNGKDGKASFIVTISGDQHEQNVYSAINELKKYASLKMLGSYNKADYEPPKTNEQLSITEDDVAKLKANLFAEKQPQKDEVIIAFSLRDRVGALRDVLEIFEEINLTRIGSSPSTRGKLDEYIFYLGFNQNLSPEKRSKFENELLSQCLQIARIV